jgi:hypothetical protein
LNHNFATDANLADLPLSISFYVQATGETSDRWTGFTLGSTQNLFITNTANKFGTLFRNTYNGTTQFNAGTDLSGQGTVSYSQSTGSIITLVFSDTSGTGSAFNGNGSKVAFYVDNTPTDNIDNPTLAQTFALGQMTAADGYLTFHGYNTRGVFDNLVVKTGTGTSPNGPAVLLTDHFNTYAGWDASGVVADQGGTYAGKGYTTAAPDAGLISHSSALNQPYGNNSLKVEAKSDYTPTYVSLNRNFATDANLADLPLSISFYVQATGETSDRWTGFTLGSTQNLFITDAANKFGTLFRNTHNGTGQFNAGANLSGQGTVSYSQSTGSVITLVFSDTSGTGSAFDGNGSKVAFYVDNTPADNIDNPMLAQTFTLGQMTAADGYLTFHGYNSRGVFDNLVVKTIAVGSDYDLWKSNNGVTGGVNDDDDNDGLTNFEEYAFGLLPNSGASSNPFVQPLDKNTGEFKYTRRNTTLFTTGINYSYEYSTTLAGAWNPLTLAGAPTSDDGNPNEVVTVTVDSSLLSNPKLFIRVKAE